MKHLLRSKHFWILLLVPISILPAQESEPIPVGFDLAQYRGRHREHPDFETLFSPTPRHTLEALKKVEKQLGLTRSASTPIIILLADYNRKKRRTMVGNAYHTRDGRVAIVFCVEFFLRGDVDYPQTLLHELVHAVMRSRMTPETYRTIPKWAREGLAVFVAGQFPSKLTRQINIQGDPDKLLTGLVETKITLKDYPYAATAIEFIEARGGPGSAARLARDLITGKPARSIVEEITGLSWKEFDQQLQRYARERFRRFVTGLAPYRECMALYTAKQFEEAATSLTRFLTSHPRSPLGSNALFYLARCHYELRRYAEAEKTFRQMITDFPSVNGLRDEAIVYAGLCAYGQGNDPLAIKTLTELITLYPDASQLVRGQYFLARSHQRLGQKEEAIRLYEAVASSNGTQTRYIQKAIEALRRLREKR